MHIILLILQSALIYKQNNAGNTFFHGRQWLSAYDIGSQSCRYQYKLEQLSNLLSALTSCCCFKFLKIAATEQRQIAARRKLKGEYRWYSNAISQTFKIIWKTIRQTSCYMLLTFTLKIKRKKSLGLIGEILRKTIWKVLSFKWVVKFSSNSKK